MSTTGLVLIAILVLVALIALGVQQSKTTSAVVVREGFTGLRYHNGRFVETLPPGRYLPPLIGHREIVAVPAMPVSADNVTVEVLSRDQFSFRVTLSAQLHVTDARLFHEAKPPAVTIYTNAGLGMFDVGLGLDRLNPFLSASLLRRMALLTLEEFMVDPLGVVAGVREEVADSLPGAVIDTLLVTQITMPPEVRKMFTEVERARREGLAALERARAEQASLRALANAARALKSNPGLAQLRQLQAMETARGAKTFILRPPADGEHGDEAAAGDIGED